MTFFEQRHLTPGGESKLSAFNIGVLPPIRLFVNLVARSFLAMTEYCLMATDKKKVSREFRVTVTVEEVDAPKVADVPAAPEHPFSDEAAEFVEESDYSPGR